MSEAEGSLVHSAERTLVSMAVLIAAQLSSSRNARIHALASRMLEKAGSAPTYFRKGFSGERAGRMVVRSWSTTNSTRSPALSPRRLRTSRGTVIWPLLLIVLERPIFTCLLYSKDSMFYRRYSDSAAGWRNFKTRGQTGRSRSILAETLAEFEQRLSEFGKRSVCALRCNPKALYVKRYVLCWVTAREPWFAPAFETPSHGL